MSPEPIDTLRAAMFDCFALPCDGPDEGMIEILMRLKARVVAAAEVIEGAAAAGAPVPLERLKEIGESWRETWGDEMSLVAMARC